MHTAKDQSWSMVGNDALSPERQGKPTMRLNLLQLSDEEKMSNVLHEFGHALGLDHEHQRSDFWDILGEKDENGDDKFIIGEQSMRDGVGGCAKANNAVFRNTFDEENGKTVTVDKKESGYDPDSIMHYW